MPQTGGALLDTWGLLTYRLPSKAPLQPKSAEAGDGSLPIRADVTFESIINDSNCPPLSLRDFEYYCEHVEFSGENVQFYKAFLRYKRAWKGLSEAERSLSPPYHAPRLHGSRFVSRKQAFSTTIQDDLGQSLPWRSVEGDAIPMMETTVADVAPSRDCNSSRSGYVLQKWDSSTANAASIHAGERDPLTSGIPRSIVCLLQAEILEFAGIDWKPCGILPLRSMVDYIVRDFLLPSSPRQLNLSYSTSYDCLQALNNTSHPDALEPAANHIRLLLVRGTLPNFIRHASRNANGPRRVFSFVISITTILIVIALTILNIVQRKPKSMRAIGIPCLWFGTTCLFAACRGSCFILALMHQFQIRPYQHSTPLEAESSGKEHHASDSTTSDTDTKRDSQTLQWHRWPIHRKLFGSKSPAHGSFRYMQNAMALQCAVHGFLVTLVCSVVVAFIPVLTS